MPSEATCTPRVLIVTNYAPDRQFSQLGHGKWLESQMPGEGFNIRAISPKKHLGGGTGEFSKWRGYVDKFVLFPATLRRESSKVDLVHIADHSNVMYGRHCRAPWGVTLHDLIPQLMIRRELEAGVRPTGQVLQKWIRTWLKRAEWVGCVSQATLDDYVRLINPDPSRCFLTPDCLYRDFHRVSLEDSARLLTEAGLAHLLSAPYLMHLGGNTFYKNRVGFLRIAEQLRQLPEFRNMRFVACGKKFDQRTREVLDECRLENSLVQIESAADDLVLALYSRAQGLIFPSLVEGFGLPVLEAMACGCPVFTSDRRPMTEVGGAAARYFDPTSPKEAACVISHAWDDRESMVREGYAQAARLSSAASSAAYAEWYRMILSGSKRPAR